MTRSRRPCPRRWPGERLGRLALLLIAAAAGCRPGPAEPSPRLAALRAEHERLHDRLDALVGKDALLSQAEADGGQVIVAIRGALVADVVREVAARYLDRVALDLEPGIQVKEAREVNVRTFLGAMKAGTWRLHVTFHRIRGVLRAKPPKLDVSSTNRVAFSLLVRLDEAVGAATVRFSWDAASVANVVCRDFEIERHVEGRVVPQDYPVTGAFLLAAGPDALTAVPDVPQGRFRLHVKVSPASWEAVRSAMQEQDKLLKCGMALDPDELMPQLEELVGRGFDLKLPRSLYRTVRFPASVRQSVSVEGREIDLVVRPNVLRVTSDTVWYSAAVRSVVHASSSSSAPH